MGGKMLWEKSDTQETFVHCLVDSLCCGHQAKDWCFDITLLSSWSKGYLCGGLYLPLIGMVNRNENVVLESKSIWQSKSLMGLCRGEGDLGQSWIFSRAEMCLQTAPGLFLWQDGPGRVTFSWVNSSYVSRDTVAEGKNAAYWKDGSMSFRLRYLLPQTRGLAGIANRLRRVKTFTPLPIKAEISQVIFAILPQLPGIVLSISFSLLSLVL